MHEKIHFGMSGGCEDYVNEGAKIDNRDAIPTASRRRYAATELEWFDLGTSDVERYEGDNGNNLDADANEEEEASQSDDGLTQTLAD
jgi:hypothetical protein